MNELNDNTKIKLSIKDFWHIITLLIIGIIYISSVLYNFSAENRKHYENITLMINNIQSANTITAVEIINLKKSIWTLDAMADLYANKSYWTNNTLSSDLDRRNYIRSIQKNISEFCVNTS